MRLLLVGCNGLLGQNLLATRSPDAAIWGLGSRPQPLLSEGLIGYSPVNITDAEALNRAIEMARPDRIINAAAMTDVDRCEREPALCRAINRDAVATMAASGLPLLHVSTDYVFDGEKGPYREGDAVSPLSVYGSSKLESEAMALAGHAANLVLRTMLLWGKGSGAKTPFPDFIRQNLMAGKRVRIVTDQWGNPTLARDLAEAIWALLGKGCRGLYHAAGPDCVSRLQWTEAVARFYGLDESLIDTCSTADLGQAARRPLRSGLISSALSRDTGFRFRGIQEQLIWLRDTPQTGFTGPVRPA